MKLRLASPHLADRFHGPMRFGRRWRGHELALRLLQFVLFVALAAFCVPLIANAVTAGARAIADMFS